MILKPPNDQRVTRLIDANLDRAREGLRVVEDWCRFGLNRKDLIFKLKDWRHQLGSHHHEIYKQARSISTDEGALLDHPSQDDRKTPNDVISANCSRIQEALRVLEEFSRTSDTELAKNAAKIRYEIYELEIILLKATAKNKRIQQLKNCNLCLITSTKSEFLSPISAALSEGIKMIQYRCKDINDREKIKQAKELATICKKNGALFIVNDRVDLALAVKADGVHLGQNDMPIEIARNLLGEEYLIGKSTHSLAQVKEAQKQRCDYLGIGPIFQSKTKSNMIPLGVDCLSEISKEISLPCFAIGGINDFNTSEVISRGVKRIAVVDAIMNTKNPALATRKLLSQLP